MLCNHFKTSTLLLLIFIVSRNVEVPKTWTTSFYFVRNKTKSPEEIENISNGSASDAKCYVKNSKVTESLLLMKF